MHTHWLKITRMWIALFPILVSFLIPLTTISTVHLCTFILRPIHGIHHTSFYKAIHTWLLHSTNFFIKRANNLTIKKTKHLPWNTFQRAPFYKHYLVCPDACLLFCTAKYIWKGVFFFFSAEITSANLSWQQLHVQFAFASCWAGWQQDIQELDGCLWRKQDMGGEL